MTGESGHIVIAFIVSIVGGLLVLVIWQTYRNHSRKIARIAERQKAILLVLHFMVYGDPKIPDHIKARITDAIENGERDD